MANRTCSISPCARPAVGRGWCINHWMRWRDHGDPRGGGPSHIGKAIDWPDGTRSCTKCHERKPLDQFHKVKNATLGRRSNCKACRSAQMKALYEAKQDELLAKGRDRAAAARAAERAANPEWWAQKDREDAERVAAGPTANVRACRARAARMSAAEKDPSVTRANLRKQYGDGCFYCGVLMSFDRVPRGTRFPANLATQEHVIPVAEGGPHTWENVVLACWRCNSSKKHTPLADWLEGRQSA
jgi:hypothetical protein